MSHHHFGIHQGSRWRSFANEREGMTFLGIVQRGAVGIGALARTDDSGYVQVNGDIVEVLNTQEVQRALCRPPNKPEGQCAQSFFEDHLVASRQRWSGSIVTSNAAPNASASTPAAPVVVVKKRCVLVRATTEAAPASKHSRFDPISLEESHASIRLGR